MTKRCFFIFLLISFSLRAESVLKKQYPNGLLTDDYGILKEADLLFEIVKDNPGATQIDKSGSVYNKWQCFLVKDVKLTYETWKDSDPGGLIGEIENLYDYRFTIRGSSFDHAYVNRHVMSHYTFWKYTYKQWKRLSKNQKYICFNGGPLNNEGREKVWYFNKMQSLIGCFSDFGGDCYTNGKNKSRNVIK